MCGGVCAYVWRYVCLCMEVCAYVYGGVCAYMWRCVCLCVEVCVLMCGGGCVCVTRYTQSIAHVRIVLLSWKVIYVGSLNRGRSEGNWIGKRRPPEALTTFTRSAISYLVSSSSRLLFGLCRDSPWCL